MVRGMANLPCLPVRWAVAASLIICRILIGLLRAVQRLEWGMDVFAAMAAVADVVDAGGSLTRRRGRSERRLRAWCDKPMHVRSVSRPSSSIGRHAVLLPCLLVMATMDGGQRLVGYQRGAPKHERV